jgi:hypothetical protein
MIATSAPVSAPAPAPAPAHPPAADRDLLETQSALKAMGIGVNLRWLRAFDQHLSAAGVTVSRSSATFQRRVYEAFLECDVQTAGAPILPSRKQLDEMHGKVSVSTIRSQHSTIQTE